MKVELNGDRCDGNKICGYEWDAGNFVFPCRPAVHIVFQGKATKYGHPQQQRNF